MRVSYNCFYASIVALHSIGATSAFQINAPHAFTKTKTTKQTESTALNMLPPMIISPIIRKYREDQEKKKIPMCSPSELKEEAAGVKVGQAVWKWPPIWPYDQEMFTPNEDIKKPDAPAGAGGMMGMMGLEAAAKAATPDVAEDGTEIKEEEEVLLLDPLEYWGVKNKETTTDLDPDAAAKLTAHYQFYLKDGMSILELGSAENSYLPKNMKFSRHIGVGANQYLMDKNPSLTSSMVVDLNKVIPDRDVDNEELRALASEPFDAIIMSNTVDFLTYPREVFRSAWYLLKPGGILINSFSAKEFSKDKFERATTKMWRSYNDDQHMWICGSLFEFSAGDGWEKLLGFDISPESAKKETDGPMAVLAQGKNNNMYAVQAIKVAQDNAISKENLESSINSRMWMLPGVEPRDKNLVCNRLVRCAETTENDIDITPIMDRNIVHLPVIYAALEKMDPFAFTLNMQSQLAAELIVNENFHATDEQMIALKQGLGLRTPSKEFWEPVGIETGAMEIDDKISLLGAVVPCFDSGNPAQDVALQAFVDGLKPMFALIRSRLKDIPESDVQLLGTELLASEILIPGRSTAEQFAAWVNALNDDGLRQFLVDRKQIRLDSKDAMVRYQDRRSRLIADYKAEQDKMKEQVNTARKERSLIFNPRTEKFEVFEQKK